ncbi:MAG TPA: SpoIIE family protein phosphatase [Candidatus Krumholzibacteria bacterium]|nr:SpoIIE family protein phosphatase [Candidatus Krumholzibacteria bacterium]
MALMLVGTVDGRELRYILSEGRHLAGRADNADLKVAQPNVSRRHAEFESVGGRVVVRDLGSHNGTHVNDDPVDGDTDLTPGDTVRIADVTFVVQDEAAPNAAAAAGPGRDLVASAEISWDEVRSERNTKRDLQSLLFRVLAKAGDLLTIPRAPAEMYEPILDLVETALLKPERIFVLLVEEGGEEPEQVASRVSGRRSADSLVLSRTMTRQVLSEKKSFLTSDVLNDSPEHEMMSMISQGIRSAIAVPLFDNEDVIGILYSDDTRPGRSFTRDQLAAFTLLANTIAVALTRARYMELEEEKRRQDAMIAAAGDILDHILPSELPPLDGYELSARLVPCFEVGGDLYDGQVLADGRYAVVIGDVTGKGMGAALLVSHILSLSRFMLAEGWALAPLMARLNRQIFQCTDFIRFSTFFLVIVDPATGRLEYANAGHNPPLVVRADGSVEECPGTGLPIGMLEDSQYGTGELVLGPGDLLAMFSDGIPETQTLDDDEYGDDAFGDLLVRERRRDLGALFATLQAELAAFRGEAPIGDDITLVTLRRKA